MWTGELATEQTLNADVTTAFPVDQAVGNLAPGVYVMVAEPAGPKADSYEGLATQWFVVSDLGLTSYFGNDGIHVFVHSPASADPKGQVEVRLLSRGNEVLATKTTTANGHAQFEIGLTRGEGALVPAMVTATEQRGSDYAFLSLKTSAFDLSDRGVAGRSVPAGLDAFVYTERGIYRSGETVFVTALLRDSAGIASTGAPLTSSSSAPTGSNTAASPLPTKALAAAL